FLLGSLVTGGLSTWGHSSRTSRSLGTSSSAMAAPRYLKRLLKTLALRVVRRAEVATICAPATMPQRRSRLTDGTPEISRRPPKSLEGARRGRARRHGCRLVPHTESASIQSHEHPVHRVTQHRLEEQRRRFWSNRRPRPLHPNLRRHDRQRAGSRTGRRACGCPAFD